MQKYKKILNGIIELLLLLLYYIVIYYIVIEVFCFHSYFFVYPYTIVSYSDVLAVIFALGILILPFLPVIFKKAVHTDLLIATIYSFLAIIIFLAITLIIGYFTKNFFENFSYNKWNNNDYCDMRHMMVESLEKQHSFVGMNRKDIYKILGKIDDKSCAYDYEEDNKICYMTYEGMMRNDFYCLYLDENDIVTGSEYISVY